MRFTFSTEPIYTQSQVRELVTQIYTLQHCETQLNKSEEKAGEKDLNIWFAREQIGYAKKTILPQFTNQINQLERTIREVQGETPLERTFGKEEAKIIEGGNNR